MKVIIVGGGQVGSYLASLLLSNGHDIRIIEQRENVFKKLEKEFKALELASNIIQESFNEIKKNVGPDLNKKIIKKFNFFSIN
jgi:Trk K+ transport system NAD-binding subunit